MTKQIALVTVIGLCTFTLPALAQNRPSLSQAEPITATSHMYPGVGIDLYTNAEWQLVETAKTHCAERNQKVARIQDVVIQIKANFDVNAEGKTQALTYPRSIISAMVQCR